MFDVGSIVGRLELRKDQWNQAIKDVKKDQKSLSGLVLKNSQQFKKMGRTMTVAGVAIIGSFGLMVKKASDAQEVFSKFDVIFKDVLPRASKEAKNLAKNYGLSTLASKDMMSATGDLLTGLGMQSDTALDLSVKTQKLAVDLASFTNYSGGAKGASDALTKAMLGEREMVKSLGIVITEEMVKNELRAKGKSKLTGLALQQAKAEAVLRIAINQSENAMGDYERTSGSLANQQRELRARLEDLWVEIGTKLIPVAKDLIKGAKNVVAQISAWIKEHPKLTGIIAKGALAVGGLLAVLGPLMMMLPGIIAALPALAAGFSALLGPIGAVAIAAAAVGVAVNKLLDNYKKKQDAEMDAMVEASKGHKQFWAFRRKLIEDEIVTVEGWAKIYNKHGRNYKRVMRAISTLPEYAYIREQWDKMIEKHEEVGESSGGLTDVLRKNSDEVMKLNTKMVDEIKKATLDEFEYRKWAAQATYEARKALLEKEKADKEAFVLLEKTLAIELEQIEKDKTEKFKEGWVERGRSVMAGLLKFREKEKEYNRIVAGFADDRMRLVMKEKDYRTWALDAWYDEQVQRLYDLYGETEKFYIAKEELEKLYAAKSKEILEGIKSGHMDMLFSIGAAVRNLFAQLGNLSQTHFNNQLIAINEVAEARMQAYDDRMEMIAGEYETEKEKIEGSLMSEQEKAAALKVLEAEKNTALKEAEEEKAKAQAALEEKRRAIQKAAFEGDKKASLAMAVISIALAITKALPNLPLVAITALAGAVQLAVIEGQTFPGYKEGGFVPEDTIARLHAGEFVVNAPDVRAMAGPGGTREDMMPGPQFHTTVKMNIYAQTLDDRTIDGAAEKLLSAIDRQKSRFGIK